MVRLTGQKIYKSLNKYMSSVKIKWPRQIFSAIQPTGEAHLGNYLGAIKNWVHFQNTEKNTVIYGIADLHSITIPKDPKQLNDNIFLMAATLFACGIDPNKSILFQQSAVPQHSELFWILGTLSTVPALSNLPQYKEKCTLVKDQYVGIFLYPVLQAADIMLYRTTHVPVGNDQIQQIEFVCHLIKRFNNLFGVTFPNCEAIIDSSSGRVKSLLDATKKMSKSDGNTRSFISLMDEPDVIHKKCKKALTDSISEITYDPNKRPGVSNLIQIHSSLTGKSPSEIVKECGNMQSGPYKSFLSEVIIEHLNPIRKKILEYLNAKEYIINELESGTNRAREIAEKTLKEVKEKTGFNIRDSMLNTLDLKEKYIAKEDNQKSQLSSV